MLVFYFCLLNLGVDDMLIPSLSPAIANASTPAAAVTPLAATAVTGDESKPKPALAPELVPKQTQASETDVQAVKKAVAVLNQSLEQGPTSVRFQLDESSGKTVVTLVDTEKNSVLLQFPSDSVLSLSGSLPLTQGSIINVKV